MKILFRKPMNQPLELMEIEEDDIHDLIGGYFTAVDIRHDIMCLMDEDGLLKELHTNYYHDIYGAIYGNVIFCARDNSEIISLSDEQIEFVKNYIGFPVIESKKN